MQAPLNNRIDRRLSLPLARLIAPFLDLLLGRRTRLFLRFLEADAVDPSHASSLDALQVSDSRVFRELVRIGVICRTKEGLFFLHRNAVFTHLKSERY